ncbi:MULTISPECIES: hypothetical protein [unclassified Paenibacillus]|uniref:hypothetical protein n=1 Tax=unclassified Paenibacillus TaxID=185978 RepID=UPI0030F6D729
MDKFHFTQLQNLVEKDQKHREKQLIHQLRFGNLSEDDRKEAERALLLIGGGV